MNSDSYYNDYHILHNDYHILQKIENKDVYIDIFNFMKTVECKDFFKYFNMREKLPNHKPKAFNAKFGPDFVRHFEMAYQIIKGSTDLTLGDLLF